MVIGSEGESEYDYDFLSSIEVLILDQADVFLMQVIDEFEELFRREKCLKIGLISELGSRIAYYGSYEFTTSQISRY